MFALQLEEDVYVTTDRDVCTPEEVWHLLQETHWASSRSLDTVRISMANSTCFFMMEGFQLIGFARVITDHVTFAYLCDVVIRSDSRMGGCGSELIRHILCHPSLSSVSQWRLKTTYAADFYSQFGFRKVSDDITHMEHYPKNA